MIKLDIKHLAKKVVKLHKKQGYTIHDSIGLYFTLENVSYGAAHHITTSQFSKLRKEVSKLI